MKKRFIIFIFLLLATPLSYVYAVPFIHIGFGGAGTHTNYSPCPDPVVCDDADACTVDTCTNMSFTGAQFVAGDGTDQNPDTCFPPSAPACALYDTDPPTGGFNGTGFHGDSGAFCAFYPNSCDGGSVTICGHVNSCGGGGPAPTVSTRFGSSPTPIPTPTPLPCAPTSCGASIPACGTTSSGVDNCGNSCTINGGKCSVVPTASPSISPTPCLGGPRGCPSPSATPSSSIIFTPTPTASFSPGPFTPTPSTSSGSGNNPPSVFSIAIDQPNYCQIGLNISVNVRWSFADVEGDSQQSYQVQLDTDSNFGSPDLDTGVIFSSTRATGFIGAGQLKYSQRYYARVRVIDTAGSLSSWY